MIHELFEELQIGEAEPDGLDVAENLVRSWTRDGGGFVEHELVAINELHGALGFGNH